MTSPGVKRMDIAAVACLIARTAYAGHIDDPLAPPVPTQLLSAKTVFLSNRGLDAGSMLTFAGSLPTVPFDRLYAALYSWGHYSLVATPADADLVLEFSVDAALFNTGMGIPIYTMFLTLTVFDPKTHFALGTVKVPLRSRVEQDVTNAVAQLVKSFEGLLGTSSVNTAQ